MREAMAMTIKKLVKLGFPKLTMADAQAILWVNGKDLITVFKSVNKS